MIGGQDIHIKVPSGAEAIGSAVRTIANHWPNAVFVLDNGPNIVDRSGDLDLIDNSEVVIYKDRSSCEKWRALGYDPSLKGTMVYLIADREDLTIVVEDEPPADISSLLSAVRNGLAEILRPVKR